jgi:D-alanyl-lipoteichoic acid acyltransferase DltB (MBOAT superfamily)
MEGPIARFSDTAEDLYAGKKIEYNNLALGYQRIMYGFFKKKLIADRLNTLVTTVFNNYSNYNGFTIFLGAIGYTVMLYMEFSGTMDVVIGSGQIFGINIPENFRQPFFSKNISEFWTRWHISLGTWFKDYVYYPISLSKPLKKLTVKLRKILGNHYGPLISGSIALFVVWFLNGLWHGAGYTFLCFGMYHFIMIAGGNFIGPLITKGCLVLHINRENKIYRILQSIKMCLLVFIGELIFRADTMKDAIGMLKGIFTRFKFSSYELLNIGIDIYDYIILIIAIIFIFTISLLKEKNIDVREKLAKKKTWIRWAILFAFIISIFIFGAYGPGYEPVDPIYADF